MTVHQMRCLRKRGNAVDLEQFSLVKTATRRSAKRHDGNRDDWLHGVRCRNAARPSFVFKVSPPEVAHIEEGIGLLAVRFRIRHSDPICGDVRRPDA